MNRCFRFVPYQRREINNVAEQDLADKEQDLKSPVLIDSGCVSNVVDKVTWDLMKRKGADFENFQEAITKTFKAYGSTKPLTTLGSFDANLEVGGKALLAKFYIFDVNEQPL